MNAAVGIESVDEDGVDGLFPGDSETETLWSPGCGGLLHAAPHVWYFEPVTSADMSVLGGGGNHEGTGSADRGNKSRGARRRRSSIADVRTDMVALARR